MRSAHICILPRAMFSQARGMMHSERCFDAEQIQIRTKARYRGLSAAPRDDTARFRSR